MQQLFILHNAVKKPYLLWRRQLNSVYSIIQWQVMALDLKHMTHSVWLIFYTIHFLFFIIFGDVKNLSCLQKDEKAAVANQQNFPPKLTFPNPQSFTRYLNQTLVFMWNTGTEVQFLFFRSFSLALAKISFRGEN